MKTTQSRFGQIEYDPAKVLHFPEGMLGFESLHDFVVMANCQGRSALLDSERRRC